MQQSSSSERKEQSCMSAVFRKTVLWEEGERKKILDEGKQNLLRENLFLIMVKGDLQTERK